MQLLDPAPAWDARLALHITLWHGCTLADWDKISKEGIDLNAGRVDVEFGRGFYTTTSRRQARHWAWLKARGGSRRSKKATTPVLIRFDASRHELSKLAWLAFVRGEYNYDDYWSFVQHCRTGTGQNLHDHRGPKKGDGHAWYDVVFGPVSAFWTQRIAMPDSDQMSFHTADGVALLEKRRPAIESVP